MYEKCLAEPLRAASKHSRARRGSRQLHPAATSSATSETSTAQEEKNCFRPIFIPFSCGRSQGVSLASAKDWLQGVSFNFNLAHTLNVVPPPDHLLFWIKLHPGPVFKGIQRQLASWHCFACYLSHRCPPCRINSRGERLYCFDLFRSGGFEELFQLLLSLPHFDGLVRKLPKPKPGPCPLSLSCSF